MFQSRVFAVWFPSIPAVQKQNAELSTTLVTPIDESLSEWDKFADWVIEIREKVPSWAFIARIYKLVHKHWLKPKIDKMRMKDESLIRIEPSA